jgi:hypothetical protein
MRIHPNRPTLARLAAGAALIGALALGACGKEGSLDRPAPLFGSKAKSDYTAEKKREARQARANRSGDNGGDPAPPAPDYGQGDPSLDPQRAAPTPGAAPNPFSNPNAGGLLQDPVANPNALPR